MVYEMNLRYVPDTDVEVLLDTGEIVSLDAYIAAQVQAPSYIVGDSVAPGAVSVRFKTPQARADALEFVAAVKPYCVAGRVQGHNCRHDMGQPCDAPEQIDAWGVMPDGN
jgi:hypothetical protein